MGSSFHSQYIEHASPSKEIRPNYSKLTYASIRNGKRKCQDHANDAAQHQGEAQQQPSHRVQSRIAKRQRNPNEIFGQKLPLNRIIETLNKEKLQNLISHLINSNPELTNEIVRLSPEVTTDDAMEELDRKLNLILTNLPYKVDPTNDYAFLRVKPLVNEFFQSLSDYALNFIPPVENNLMVSISFLKNFLLKILHKLPKFEAVEFKYYYNLTIEKFNLILLNSVNSFLNEKRQNLLLIINENWIDDFRKINDLNNNNFIKIQDLLQHEMDNYYNSGAVILNNDSTSDKKLLGLDNLLNFAYQNSPLSNTTLNNV